MLGVPVYHNAAYGAIILAWNEPGPPWNAYPAVDRKKRVCSPLRKRNDAHVRNNCGIKCYASLNRLYPITTDPYAHYNTSKNYQEPPGDFLFLLTGLVSQTSSPISSPPLTPSSLIPNKLLSFPFPLAIGLFFSSACLAFSTAFSNSSSSVFLNFSVSLYPVSALKSLRGQDHIVLTIAIT